MQLTWRKCPKILNANNHYKIRTFANVSLPTKRFKFFSNEFYENFNTKNTTAQPMMHFHNCTVYFGGDEGTYSFEKRRKCLRIYSSDESSQEQ